MNILVHIIFYIQNYIIEEKNPKKCNWALNLTLSLLAAKAKRGGGEEDTKMVV